MQSTAMIALSAAALSVTGVGMVSVLRGMDAPAGHRYLLAVFGLIAGLAGLPLIIAFAPVAISFYLPAMLPMLLALPPALYAYTEALTSPGGKPPLNWRHGLVPLGGIMVTLGYWALPGAARQTMFLEGNLPEGIFPALLALLSFVLIFLWSLLSLGYLLFVLRHLYAYRARLRDQFSNLDKLELRWIEWLMVFLVILWAAVALSLVKDNIGAGLWFSGEWVLVLTIGLLLFLFIAAPVRAPAEEMDTDMASDEQPQMSAEKYARSALSDEHARRLADRIEAAMRDTQLYLDANLSLAKLSKQVGGAPNLVSQTLNTELGSTFFDYVARWRIEASKPLVIAGEASVLTIAMDVGFNSKSTFYKAFRKQTGMTPSAYRQAHITV